MTYPLVTIRGRAGDGSLLGESRLSVLLLTIAATAHNCSYCPCGVRSPVRADRLHIQSFPNCKVWRVLSTTDVGGIVQVAGCIASVRPGLCPRQSNVCPPLSYYCCTGCASKARRLRTFYRAPAADARVSAGRDHQPQVAGNDPRYCSRLEPLVLAQCALPEREWPRRGRHGFGTAGAGVLFLALAFVVPRLCLLQCLRPHVHQ